MGTLKTDDIIARTGNAMNLGVSGDTVTVPTGASLVITDGLAIASLPTVTVAKGGTGSTTASAARTALGLVIDTDIQSYDAATVKKDEQNTFTKAQLPSTYTAALSATSGVLDFDTYQNFIITLAAGSNTLAAPTTEASQIGQSGVMVFIQPSSGSAATISLHGDYETAAAAGLTISTANNDYDVVPYIIKADNSVLLGAPQLNFG